MGSECFYLLSGSSHPVTGCDEILKWPLTIWPCLTSKQSIVNNFHHVRNKTFLSHVGKTE